MLTADQQFNALTPDSTLENITITTADLTVPAANGLSIAIGTTATAANLTAVESMVGLFKQANAYLLSEIVSLTNDAGVGVAIAVSVNAEGQISRDATQVFAIKVGEDVADVSATHVIDAMFKLCVAKLLQTGKDGYV